MKQNKKPKRAKLYSVKWKLILILVLLTSVSLLFIRFAQNIFFGKIYTDIKMSELVEGGKQLEQTEGDSERSKTAQKLREDGICVVIYRLEENPRDLSVIANFEAKPNCNCLVHRLLAINGSDIFGRPGAGIENIQKQALIYDTVKQAEKAGGSAYIDSRNDSNAKVAGDDLTRVILEQEDDRSTVAYFLNTTVVPLDATVKTLNMMMLYVSVTVVIAAIIFALLIAVWITRPIEEINRSAKQLAQCNYDVKFERKGYREIAELSDTLNYAASELAKVDHLQKELVANISHDLRTPLTLIAGYAEAMRDLPDENTEENLQIIIDESNRMKALVNDVLDISKIKAGTARIVLQPLQLTNCVESELTRYNKLRDREGYNIEFKYDALVTVNADYTRLMQVVYNLVNNAVNYTGDDKKVTVVQSVDKNRVRISVTDTGEGIDEKELPLIWERYYKVDKTHKRATVGTGLGLSIVKTIVEAHGGTCGVRSKPGEGSTFWFELEVLSSVSLDQKQKANETV